MKVLALSLVLLTFATGAFAQEKSCVVDLSHVSEVLRDPSLSADAPVVVGMTLTYGGRDAYQVFKLSNLASKKVSEAVTVDAYSIREDLAVEDPNAGEVLIARTMSATLDSVMGHIFETGVDLHAVRSIKVFNFGDPSAERRTAVIETFDARGKALGSFMAGPAVRPCQR